MGAKTWMLVYAKADVAEALKRSPQLDRDATLQLATSLFPKDKLDAIGEGDLSYTCPADDELTLAVFRAFLFWRQRSLESTIRLSYRRHSFPQPFWSGPHPATDDPEVDYPFPFHPLELEEAALKEFFGYQLEGFIDATLLEPESIPLVKYKRKRSGWKLW